MLIRRVGLDTFARKLGTPKTGVTFGKDVLLRNIYAPKQNQ
jgi:hypothetical protein